MIASNEIEWYHNEWIIALANTILSIRIQFPDVLTRIVISLPYEEGEGGRPPSPSPEHTLKRIQVQNLNVQEASQSSQPSVSNAAFDAPPIGLSPHPSIPSFTRNSTSSPLKAAHNLKHEAVAPPMPISSVAFSLGEGKYFTAAENTAFYIPIVESAAIRQALSKSRFLKINSTWSLWIDVYVTLGMDEGAERPLTTTVLPAETEGEAYCFYSEDPVFPGDSSAVRSMLIERWTFENAPLNRSYVGHHALFPKLCSALRILALSNRLLPTFTALQSIDSQQQSAASHRPPIALLSSRIGGGAALPTNPPYAVDPAVDYDVPNPPYAVGPAVDYDVPNPPYAVDPAVDYDVPNQPMMQQQGVPYKEAPNPLDSEIFCLMHAVDESPILEASNVSIQRNLINVSSAFGNWKLSIQYDTQFPRYIASRYNTPPLPIHTLTAGNKPHPHEGRLRRIGTFGSTAKTTARHTTHNDGHYGDESPLFAPSTHSPLVHSTTQDASSRGYTVSSLKDIAQAHCRHKTHLGIGVSDILYSVVSSTIGASSRVKELLRHSSLPLFSGSITMNPSEDTDAYGKRHQSTASTPTENRLPSILHRFFASNKADALTQDNGKQRQGVLFEIGKSYPEIPLSTPLSASVSNTHPSNDSTPLCSNRVTSVPSHILYSLTNGVPTDSPNIYTLNSDSLDDKLLPKMTAAEGQGNDSTETLVDLDGDIWFDNPDLGRFPASTQQQLNEEFSSIWLPLSPLLSVEYPHLREEGIEKAGGALTIAANEEEMTQFMTEALHSSEALVPVCFVRRDDPSVRSTRIPDNSVIQRQTEILQNECHQFWALYSMSCLEEACFVQRCTAIEDDLCCEDTVNASEINKMTRMLISATNEKKSDGVDNTADSYKEVLHKMGKYFRLLSDLQPSFDNSYESLGSLWNQYLRLQQ